MASVAVPANKITLLLDCTICHETLTNPVIICSNRHIADRACVNQWLLRNPICPECREQVDPKKPLIEDRLVVQLLNLCQTNHVPHLQEQSSTTLDIAPPLNSGADGTIPEIVFPQPSAPPFDPSELPSQSNAVIPQLIDTASKVISTSGKGVKQSYQEAKVWCEKAAAQGHINVQKNLRDIHEYHRVVQLSHQEEVDKFEKTATQALDYAKNNPDEKYLFRKVTETLNRESLLKIDLTLAKTHGLIDRAKSRLQTVVDLHGPSKEVDLTPLAEFLFYDCREEDFGVILTAKLNTPGFKSFSQPLRADLFREVASMGTKLKKLLLERSHQKAFEFYKKQALEGNTEAQFTLGRMFYRGQGVEGSFTTAFSWWEKAAAKGHIEAQQRLEKLRKK